ncbi:MAG: hypothetical protein R3F54_28125 [Alphaproteobacteria bacterium]
MPSALEIEDQAETISALLNALATKAVVQEHDVRRLRHAFYKQGRIDRRLAAELFHANRIMRARHADWTEFYLEALTDFFLTRRGEMPILSAEPETVLLGWLGEGEPIVEPGERRLALRILLLATNGPKHLKRHVLHSIEDNLLRGNERWIDGGKRDPGIIDALDIHLIQRLLRGAGGGYPRRICGAVVTFLLSLDRQALRFVDPEGWRRLLVASLARHLWADLPSACATNVDSMPAITAGLRQLFDGHQPSADVLRLQHDVLAVTQMLHRGNDDRPSEEAEAVKESTLSA